MIEPPWRPDGEHIANMICIAVLVMMATVLFVAGYDSEPRTKPPLGGPGSGQLIEPWN